MGRSPCCSKVGLRRGPWSTKEDTLLTNYIQQHGEGQWRALPKNAGLLRCGKSCRLRWMNYLRPGIKRGNITDDEEDLIVRLHGLLGNRWSLIAGRLPGRTDNEIKNHWNTHLLKKLSTAGISREIPKPREIENSGSAVKKKKQRKKTAAAGEDDPVIPTKTKVYLPKPIRVSSAFTRTSSYESVGSAGGSSSDGGEAAEKVGRSCAAEAWEPLFEAEDYGDGFLLDEGLVLPEIERTSDSMSGDVKMLERVYDEYLQLLQMDQI